MIAPGEPAPPATAVLLFCLAPLPPAPNPCPAIPALEPAAFAADDLPPIPNKLEPPAPEAWLFEASANPRAPDSPPTARKAFPEAVAGVVVAEVGEAVTNGADPEPSFPAIPPPPV